jgi:hypothetical protein
MAKIQNILHGKWEHDAGLGGYCCSRNIYFFGPPLRPFPAHKGSPLGRNIHQAVFHRFARCVRGRAGDHDGSHARISFGATRAIIPQVRQLLFQYFHYSICVLNGCSHGMEIALLVSCLLFSPPGAAGSLSKPGDGMMELVLRPKMGTYKPTTVAMPRAEEHRPPIPRMPSSHEKIL